MASLQANIILDGWKPQLGYTKFVNCRIVKNKNCMGLAAGAKLVAKSSDMKTN